MTTGGRSPHPNALPNYQNAVILREKLETYALNAGHPDGKHKALVFRSALGFEQWDWEILRDSILSQLPYYEALPGKTDRYGTRYNVNMLITGPNGRTVDVVTAWIIEAGNYNPRFVTARVK
jgi:hypothetical protein